MPIIDDPLHQEIIHDHFEFKTNFMDAVADQVHSCGNKNKKFKNDLHYVVFSE